MLPPTSRHFRAALTFPSTNGEARLLYTEVFVPPVTTFYQSSVGTCRMETRLTASSRYPRYEVTQTNQQQRLTAATQQDSAQH